MYSRELRLVVYTDQPQARRVLDAARHAGLERLLDRWVEEVVADHVFLQPVVDDAEEDSAGA